jgi:predicted permease
MDLRYAIRVLRGNPGFAIPAILALALGIGAVTSIFSVVDTMLLRPLPYADADRLASVTTTLPGLRFTGIISAEYLDWSERNQVFESFAAMTHSPSAAALSTPDGPVQVQVTHVTANFLSTLRVGPMLGRAFAGSDEQPGQPAMMISYGLWQDKFHGDLNIPGRRLTLDGAPGEIVGVLPRNFHFPQNLRVDVLLPFQIDIARTRARIAMGVWDSIGRLKPGVSIDQARANFATLFASSRAADTRMYRDLELRVTTYQERLTGNVRVTLWVLVGAVGFVLLIACANVANLLLARATGREREIAVRSALGASRSRLIRQLLTESVMLGLVGCAGGIAIATGAIALLRRIAPADLPRAAELAVDVRVLAFATMLAVLTGIGFGILPALAATRPAVRFGRSGPRGVLVGLEVALSLILLVGAGLLFQSLWRLQHKNLGFEPQEVFTTVTSVRGARLAELRDRLIGVPGTLSVAFADSLPPNGGSSMTTFSREGRPLPEPYHRGDNMIRRRVDPAYFKTLGIPLKRGRGLTAADGEDVAVINELLARRYFPDEDPIGKKIDVNPVNRPAKTIVGIVGDVKNQGLGLDSMAEMYFHLSGNERVTHVIVRSMGDPAMVATVLRQQIRTLDPQTPATIQTMQQQFSEMTARPRFNGILFGSFAAIALALAVIGIYGVISFTVARRAQEIGIRMALGADSRRLIGLFMKESMGPVGGGIAAGLLGAVAMSRSLASLLYDVKPIDPPTYAVVGVVLCAVAVSASIVPARRAARVDPMTVLRAE